VTDHDDRLQNPNLGIESAKLRDLVSPNDLWADSDRPPSRPPSAQALGAHFKPWRVSGRRGPFQTALNTFDHFLPNRRYASGAPVGVEISRAGQARRSERRTLLE